MSWNLSIQHAITNNVVVDMAYVGNHGTKFMSHVDLNQADPVQNFWGFGVGGGQTFAGLCNANKNTDSCDGSSLEGVIFNNRPYNSKFPYLGTITNLGNGDYSNYNGLQISVTARNYRGLSMVSGYTFSKSLDVASGNGSDVGIDSYTPWANYGRANSDVRHRITFSPTYNFPSVMGYGGLLEGWRINANLKYQTGRGYDAGGGDFLGNGRGDSQRWDFTGDAGDFVFDRHKQDIAIFHPSGASASGENPQTGLDYVDADLAINTSLCTSASRSLATLEAFGCWTQGGSAITPPSLGSFGTMYRNMLSGPSVFLMDMSLTKTQKITERLSAQFRAEFFNILNHPVFAQPENGLGCDSGGCNFGQSTDTPDTAATNPVLGTGGPRRMQFGVKLTF
jgi:hypothetical protein